MATEWNGLADHLSSVGDGWATFDNISTAVINEARLRPGLATKTALAGTSLSDIYDSVNGQYVLAASDTIDSAQPGDSSSNELETGLDTTYPGTWAKASGRSYYANGFDLMRVVDDGVSNAAEAGIAGPTAALGAPTQAAGSNTDTGVHLLRYRYYNSKSLYYSNPSDAVSVTVSATATDGELTFTIGTSGTDIIRSTDPKVDQILIEMTLADGTVYYIAEYVNQTESSVVIDISDSTLSVQPIVAGDADGFGHEQPPIGRLIQEHRGRMFVIAPSTWTKTGVGVTNGSASVTGSGFSTEWAGYLVRVGTDTETYRIESATASTITLSENYAGATNASATIYVFSAQPDLLYWSLSGRPESFRAAQRARRVMQGVSDIPSALASYYGDLLIIGQRSVRRLVYVTDPAGAELVTSDTNYGVFNQRCVVWAEGYMYGWGASGVWRMSGTRPVHISKPCDRTWRSLYDATKTEQAHGTYDPDERTITWWFVASGDSLPKRAICYDIDKGVWSTRTWLNDITASTSLAYDGDNALYVSDNTAGATWAATEDVEDGIDSGAATVVSVGSGATNTTFNVTPSIQADAVGVYAYIPSTGESGRISANTTSQITLAAPLSGAPAEGTEVWLGRIDATVKTKDLVLEMDGKARPSSLALSFEPTEATARFELSYFLNNSASAQTFEVMDASEYATIDGVSISPDGNALYVDGDGGSGDGYVAAPMPSDWSRRLAFQIRRQKPIGNMRMADATLKVMRDDSARMMRE